MDSFGIGARMRAARHLADIRSVKALAKAIGVQGLGETKLRQIEREEDAPAFRDLREIAEACGLGVEWFTADFSRLAEISADPRQRIAAVAAAAVARSQAQRNTEPGGQRPPQAVDGEC